MAGIPGPSMFAFVGYGLPSLKHPGPVGVALRERFGDVVRFGFGPMRYFMLFGREANELVLGARNDAFLWGPAVRSLEIVDGPTALVLTDGEEHKRRRRLVQPAFATRRIDSAVPTIVAEVDRIIDGMRVGEQLDLYELYRGAVRRIVTRVLFGEAPGGLADELGAALEPALEFIERPPQLTGRGMPGRRRALRGRAAADAIVDREIVRRRTSDALGDDVLGTLLATDLTDSELRDQVVSLIAAGYETTSGAVAFSILELLRQPDEWARVAAEVEAVLSDGRAPTADDLQAMPYVAAVVNETLRLWPPPFAGRYTTQPVEFQGHVVPGGSTIVFSPYVTHRDRDVWGDDADMFRPSRWLEADPEPFTFIPFGGAYRKCIGFALALTEMQTVVARLAQRTSLQLVAPDVTDLGTGIASMRPEYGVRVTVEDVRRENTVAR